MSEIDDLWQSILEDESLRLRALPFKELIEIDAFSSHIVTRGTITFEYGLWHITPGTYSQTEHSFIFMAERHLLLKSLHTKHLTGFALNSEGEVIPINEDLLYSFD